MTIAQMNDLKEEYLFCLKIKDDDGTYKYSAPRSKQELDEAVKAARVDGQVCLCVIKPLCDIQVTVSIPWEKALNNARQ